MSVRYLRSHKAQSKRLVARSTIFVLLAQLAAWGALCAVEVMTLWPPKNKITMPNTCTHTQATSQLLQTKPQMLVADIMAELAEIQRHGKWTICSVSKKDALLLRLLLVSYRCILVVTRRSHVVCSAVALLLSHTLFVVNVKYPVQGVPPATPV